VAGRTGAGKSSILNCLFRLSPVSAGSILIDGVNIAHVRLQRLRSRMTVVPQSPFLFGGTLRENLDPMGSASDDQLWEVLEKCHMKRAVIAAGQGLSLVVSEGGNSLSLGQRQLLCLARSLLSTACVRCPQLSLSHIHPQSISYEKTLIHKL
jgi:ATP-binding cassette subfamily C (CFTR/MRP) protein 10